MVDCHGTECLAMTCWFDLRRLVAAAKVFKAQGLGGLGVLGGLRGRGKRRGDGTKVDANSRAYGARVA